MRPKAIAVKPMNDYKLLLTFDNGENRIFDVKPMMNGDWFSKLKDPNVFNTVHINGLSVQWSGEQDICPDELYYDSIPTYDLEKI